MRHYSKLTPVTSILAFDVSNDDNPLLHSNVNVNVNQKFLAWLE